MEFKPEDSSCKRSRWQILKSQLNNLSLEEFLDGVEQKAGAVILDVRRPDEYDKGHLPGAVNLNYLGEDFIDRLLSFPVETPYFVYCRSCRRSLRVCTNMLNAGFQEVYNLEGGLGAYPEEVTKVILSE
jgi:rhodanese-related sulfurtransferase